MSVTALNEIDINNNNGTNELKSIIQSPPSTILHQPLTISKIQLYSSYDDEYYDITNQNNNNNNNNYVLASSKHIASSTSSLNLNNPITNSWSDLNNYYYTTTNNNNNNNGNIKIIYNKSQSSLNNYK